MKLRRMVLAAAVLMWGALGTSTPASSQTPQRTACEAYCAAIAAGCYVFFGVVVGDACARMYEGCLDGCHTALLEMADEEEGSGSGGGGF